MLIHAPIQTAMRPPTGLSLYTQSQPQDLTGQRPHAMILRNLSICLAIILLASQSTAHRIEVDPGDKTCFFETLQPQDRVGLTATCNLCLRTETRSILIDRLKLTFQMTVTYEVGGSSSGGHLDIDFYVSVARLAQPHCTAQHCSAVKCSDDDR